MGSCRESIGRDWEGGSDEGRKGGGDREGGREMGREG